MADLRLHWTLTTQIIIRLNKSVLYERGESWPEDRLNNYNIYNIVSILFLPFFSALLFAFIPPASNYYAECQRIWQGRSRQMHPAKAVVSNNEQYLLRRQGSGLPGDAHIVCLTTSSVDVALPATGKSDSVFGYFIAVANAHVFGLFFSVWIFVLVAAGWFRLSASSPYLWRFFLHRPVEIMLTAQLAIRQATRTYWLTACGGEAKGRFFHRDTP